MRLALPVIFSQLGQITVQLADTAMVGNYGGNDPTPLAAVSYASNLFFIVFIAVMGVTFGLTPLVGEHYAKGNKAHACKLLKNGAVLFTSISIATTLLLIAMRPLFAKMGAVMIASGSDASINEVVEMALPYYDIILWSLLPVMIWGTIKQFLEGIGNTRITMVTIIISNAINILLNWIFIFGKLGIEPMGAIGAGWATLISRIAQCLMLVGYFIYAPQFKEYTSKLFSRTRLSINAMREILRVGTPISFQMAMEASAFTVAGLLVLAFGAHSVSAYQIGVNMMNVTFMIVIAIGSATTIICSHIYGRRDFGKLRNTMNASFQMGLAWNVSVAILYIIFRYQIPSLFTTNQEVIDITASMFIFIALFQVSDCLQALSISILRGLQDVKVIIPIVFISYVVLNIPVGYILAFKCGMQANGLIIGFIVGLSCSALLTTLRVRRNVKQMERLSEN